MEQAGTYKYKLEKLKKALEGFDNALNINLNGKTEVEKDIIKNGQVQKFEYCIELLWKTAKFYLFDIHGIECNSPKSCIKLFYQNSDISDDDYEALISMINSRNEISHIYDEQAFDNIYNKLPMFFEVMKTCLNLLENK